MSNVYFACDHAGFELKNTLLAQLRAMGYGVEDLGALSLDPTDDYPDFVIPCAREVAGDPNSFGVVIGKSGQGEAMAANRVVGARAGVYYGGPLDRVKLMREDNNANVLSLAAGFITNGEALEAVKTFLTTPFSGEARHMRRIAKF